MSSSSSKKQQEEELKRCGCCGRDDLALKNCSGCGSVAYCDAKCQTADWPSHKTVCNRIKKEKKAQQEKANEAPKSSGSGSGLGDMGSILAALMPPPRPQRYDEVDVWNACFQDHHGEVEKMLRQLGLDLNDADPDDGITAAFVSAAKGHAQCLRLLALNNADLTKRDKQGGAPIHVACQNGRLDCIDILFDNGIDANVRTADEYGNTPAIISSMNGHVKALAIVLNRGADPNLANNHGFTAVHRACQYGHLKCIFLLVSRSADLNKKDVDGHTPLDIARRYKQRECVNLLLANGAVGMRKEDLPPVSEDLKVCMSASLIHAVLCLLSIVSYP